MAINVDDHALQGMHGFYSSIGQAFSSVLESGKNKVASMVAGNITHKPEDLYKEGGLSDPAKKLLIKAFHNIKAEDILDYHSHIITMVPGKGWVNPAMKSTLQGRIYLYAAVGPESDKLMQKSDDEISRIYIERFVSCVRNFRDVPNILDPSPVDPTANHARAAAFAFDYRYDANGNPDQQGSTFYVSNDYVFELADTYPDVFFPVISINPEKGMEKALSELKDAHKKFIDWKKKHKIGDHVPFMMKWLPNAMNISPDKDEYAPFYKKMAELECVLLSHTGHEKAVHGEEFQKLGNPQLLSQAGKYGIKIIHAHCGSLGKNKDIHKKDAGDVDNTDHAINELKGNDNQFGDISAITLFTRMKKIDKIGRNISQDKLVFGSDYPLPSINALVPLKPFLDKGMVTTEEANSLREIYQYNPLLFDFALKRVMRYPQQSLIAQKVYGVDPKAGKKIFKRKVFDATLHNGLRYEKPDSESVS